jgi:hypothetical protein
MENRLPTGTFAPDLSLKVAGFPAGTAIVNAVFAQADFIKALAQGAVLVAGAASFRLIADHAHEFFGHCGRLSRFGAPGNGPMVDGLAVSIAEEVQDRQDKHKVPHGPTRKLKKTLAHLRGFDYMTTMASGASRVNSICLRPRARDEEAICSI